MARFIEQQKDKQFSLPSHRIDLEAIRAGGSKVAQGILKLLASRPHYSHEIAKLLNLNEQLVYYHTRKLEHAGLIEEERRESVQGGSAKYYRLAAPAFTVVLGKMQETPGPTIQTDSFLHPFIVDGRPDFHIVVGSPDPHGPEMARAKDGSYAIDIALFLGSFCAERPGPVVRLDTEFAHQQLTDNLVIIGGPIVNTVAAKINKKIPLIFEDSKTILDTRSGKRYESDEIGIIVKTQNPFAKRKSILYIAGRRQAGTKAAILALLLRYDELTKGGPKEIARIVRGRDLDSDGIIDDVVFEA